MAPGQIASRWLAAWAGGAMIAIANGIVREATFGRRVRERTAHQLSGLTLVSAFAAYFSALQRRWPLPSRAEALRVGGAWLGLTVAFEFSFGRRVAKLSWRELLADYDLRRGRIWPLVLVWVAVGPEVTRRLRRP